MTIDADWIAAQVAELTAAEAQLTANLNAIAGARQAYAHVLAHLTEGATPTPQGEAHADATPQ